MPGGGHWLWSVPSVPLVAGPMALADDDDDDDEPNAKKPRTDDGSLVPEETWLSKYPTNVAVIVQEGDDV